MENRRALLVTYPDRFVIQESQGLAEAAEYEVAKIATQQYLSRAQYGVGSGKAEELRGIVHDLGVDAILFDERLKSVQIYNLAKLTGVEVIDREKLILEIFSKRASTAEAKLQVQLAELRYEMPRAREKVRLAKMGEQPGFFGLGKYEVDVYYRAIKKRVAVLNGKLRGISKRRELYRLQRQKLNIASVSLAGYTGAGKTTLFNNLTGEEKEVDKGVFTTLTTSTRALDLYGSRILVSDTVGFISRLPTYMIESFKSTLEELTYANLVLLVLDSSEPLSDFVEKYWSCINILAELQVPLSRVILVFNKSDLAGEDDVEVKMKTLAAAREKSAVISAKLGQGIARLKSIIRDDVLDYVESSVTLTQDDMRDLSHHLDWLRKSAAVNIASNSDGSATVLIKGPLWAVDRFRERVARL